MVRICSCARRETRQTGLGWKCKRGWKKMRLSVRMERNSPANGSRRISFCETSKSIFCVGRAFLLSEKEGMCVGLVLAGSCFPPTRLGRRFTSSFRVEGEAFLDKTIRWRARWKADSRSRRLLDKSLGSLLTDTNNSRTRFGRHRRKSSCEWVV